MDNKYFMITYGNNVLKLTSNTMGNKYFMITYGNKCC